jgi:DNA-binding transcriptional LysR family regulator
MKGLELTDLDAFAAVAQRRSFRGAAALRATSASTLSEAVQRLEDRLGVRLLNRTTRSVTPTDAGAKLLERLSPALREISAAVEAINDLRDSPVGTLRLNVPGSVASLVLPGILPTFMRLHPGISVEVATEESFVDVVARGFDAGIRYEERLEQDMVAVPIGPRFQRFALGASAAYVAARGRPEGPRDLMEHACIRHRFPSGVTQPWEFERGTEVIRIVPVGTLVAGSIDIERAAAVAGMGLVYSFEEWLAPAFASGALMPLLSDWWPRFSGPLLYFPSRSHMPGPLRAFVDFIKSSNA